MNLEIRNIKYFWEKLENDPNITFLLSSKYNNMFRAAFNDYTLEDKFIEILEILIRQSFYMKRIFNIDHALGINSTDIDKHTEIVRQAVIYTLFLTKCLDEMLNKCYTIHEQFFSGWEFDFTQILINKLWKSGFILKKVSTVIDYKVYCTVEIENFEEQILTSRNLTELPLVVTLTDHLLPPRIETWKTSIRNLRNTIQKGLNEFNG